MGLPYARLRLGKVKRSMTDYLWNSSSKAALDDAIFAATNGEVNQFVAYIGPRRGTPAFPQTTLESGEVIPARPAVGDQNKWYVNIRTDLVLEKPDGVDDTDKELSEALLGVWA